MRTKKIKVLGLLIFIVALLVGMTACDLFDGEDTPEVDIEMIAEETTSKPVDYLNLRESEMKFTVQEGIQEGVITFVSESQFEPIVVENGYILDKVEFSEGKAELDILTYAEDEKLMVTVETLAGEQIEQFSITLDNVEPIMASDAEALDEEEGDFDLDTPRFGFFMAPYFESKAHEEVEHNFYSYYSASAFLDLGLDELNAVVVYMLENPEDSYFVNSAFENGYSSYTDFLEYGSKNLQNDIDDIADFYDKAGLDKVGHVGDEYPTETGIDDLDDWIFDIDLSKEKVFLNGPEKIRIEVLVNRPREELKEIDEDKKWTEESPVEVFKENEKIGYLFDSGYLEEHGNELRGDRYYSNYFEFDFEETGIYNFELVVTDAENQKHKVPFEIEVMEGIEDKVNEVDETHEKAEKELNNIIEEYGADREQNMTELKSRLLEDDQVNYVHKQDNNLIITHENGMKSFINFQDGTTKDIRNNMSSSESSRRVEGEIPLEEQTRGDTVALIEGAEISAGLDNVGSRNVFLWAPYCSQFSPNCEASVINDILGESELGYDVSIYEDEEANLTALKDMHNYGLIVFTTHGVFQDNSTWVVTNEFEVDLTEYYYELDNDYMRTGKTVDLEEVEQEDEYIFENIYFVEAGWFEGNLNGVFSESIIFNNSCQSAVSPDLWHTFDDLGAGAYLGWDANVYSAYAHDTAIDLVEGIEDGENTIDDFYEEQTGPGGANLILWGNEDLIMAPGLINGDFSDGLTGWTPTGDGRAITAHAFIEPTTGDNMGIISTGLGYTDTYGALEQSFQVPEDASSLYFDWNYISEEFLNWIGSIYQDPFRVTINGEEVYYKTVDDIAEEYEAQKTNSNTSPYEIEAPSGYLEPVYPDIVYDMGGPYMTDWRTTELDISDYQGQEVTLKFEAFDEGDEIYDTAILLDYIRFEGVDIIEPPYEDPSYHEEFEVISRDLETEGGETTVSINSLDDNDRAFVAMFPRNATEDYYTDQLLGFSDISSAEAETTEAFRDTKHKDGIKEIHLNLGKPRMLTQEEKEKVTVLEESYGEGDTAEFFVIDEYDEDGSEKGIRNFVLAEESESALVWVQEEDWDKGEKKPIEENYSAPDPEEIAHEYEKEVRGIKNYFGREAKYEKDESAFEVLEDIAEDQRNKLNILVYEIPAPEGKRINGYHSRADLSTEYTSENYKVNDRKMVYINNQLEGQNFFTTLTHEFQHHIHASEMMINGLDVIEDHAPRYFIDEGFSELSEEIYSNNHGINVENRGEPFFENPSEYSLTVWTTNRTGEYGVSYLFARYLYEQYGNSILTSINQSTASSSSQMKNTIVDNIYDVSEFDKLFENWALALLLDGEDEIQQDINHNRYKYPDTDLYSYFADKDSPVGYVYKINPDEDAPFSELLGDIRGDAIKYREVDVESLADLEMHFTGNDDGDMEDFWKTVVIWRGGN